MFSTEIVDYAIRQGWLNLSGRTPAHSLQGAIWLDIKKHGTNSRFVMVGSKKAPVRRKYWLKGLKNNSEEVL